MNIASLLSEEHGRGRREIVSWEGGDAGRALPRAGGLRGRRQAVGLRHGGHDWPPSKIKLTHYQAAGNPRGIRKRLK